MLLVEDIGQLLHQLVALCVFASLSQVVVGQQLVEDALVGTLVGALALVCCAASAVKIVVADGVGVVHVLHVVKRLHVILYVILALAHL